jgi:hypothetical protein
LEFNKIRLFFISKLIAFKRRFSIFINKDFNPYPDVPGGMNFSPSEFQNEQIKRIKPKFNFDNYSIKKSKNIKKKIENLISLKKNLNFYIIKKTKTELNKAYIRKRIYVSLDKNRDLPVDIVYKKDLIKAKGIILCLQGTNSGAHLNLGEIRMPADIFKVASGSSLALQAADNNYIAVSFDRIGYGERREKKIIKPSALPVIDTSLHSLALGRTLLGESLSEIYTITNWLKKEYNSLPLWGVGYSSAGNILLIASSLFPNNIDGICVGGCVGFFKDTILKRGVSAHLEVLNCHEWFEQQIFLQLMVPRPCIIIAGVNDHIWPYAGAKKVVDLAKPIYKEFNCSKNLSILKGKYHHTYYPDLMWPAINQYLN